MNVVDLTPSPQTCRALAHAGFPQDTVFMWGHSTCLPSLPHVRPLDAVVEADAVAAPVLSEVLARLPQRLDFAVPHPILGTVARAHALQICYGDEVSVGYHLAGSHEVQCRTVAVGAVEAVALLYLALHSAGLLPEVEHEGMNEDMRLGEQQVLAKAA